MNTSCETAMLLTAAYLVERHDTTWVVTLNSEAIDQPMLAADDGTWLSDSGIRTLEIRCHALAQANSVFIAWLIRLAQVDPDIRVILTGANPRVALLLRRLRLEALVRID